MKERTNGICLYFTLFILQLQMLGFSSFCSQMIFHVYVSHLCYAFLWPWTWLFLCLGCYEEGCSNRGGVAIAWINVHIFWVYIQRGDSQTIWSFWFWFSEKSPYFFPEWLYFSMRRYWRSHAVLLCFTWNRNSGPSFHDTYCTL